MHTEPYKHPAPYSPDFDYLGGMQRTHDHIMRETKQYPHTGKWQHLGGAASYNDHLQELHYGQGHAVKKELKRVMDYLYYYSDTGHELYKFLAEDAFMHVEQLQADIHDPKEKEHVKYYLDCVKEYMSWLKPDKTGTSFQPHQPSMPYGHNSGVSL